MLRVRPINFRASCGDLRDGEFLGDFFTDRKAAADVNLFHVEQIRRSGGATAAGFELLAASARARVIAADFRKLALEGEFKLRRSGLVGGGGGDLSGFRGFGIQIQVGP